MQDIPFRRFEGFIKQLSHDKLQPLEQELFELLFPSYHDSDRTPGERRRRRFAEPGFPRRRYYSIADDSLGTDHQTLAHELRAYLNRIDCGTPEVIDLAGGCFLHLDGEQVELPPEQAMAVVIRDPDTLPAKYRALPFQHLATLKGKPVECYRFPYWVLPRGIDRVIDLRWPSVREWFFETFRAPPSEPDSALIADASEATIAYSRFHDAAGRAPVPSSFWKMLPTLVNPDLGGGNPGTTGSTLLCIAQWMWQHEVSALIYPSARCNAKVVLEKGRLQQATGWNLVDYQGATPRDGETRAVTFDPSPWSWVALPKGVVVQVASAGDMAGSFALGGMADYWGQDYLQQTQALAIARQLHGQFSRPGEVTPEVRARSLWLGVLCMRWLRMALLRRGEAEVHERLLELHGLALPLGLYHLTGRAGEVCDQLRRGKLSAALAVSESLAVAARIGSALEADFSDAGVAQLVAFGSDLELLVLTAEALLQTGHRAAEGELPDLAGKYGAQLPAWFGSAAARPLREFLLEMPRWAAEAGAGTRAALSRGESLIQWAYKSLRCSAPPG